MHALTLSYYSQPTKIHYNLCKVSHLFLPGPAGKAPPAAAPAPPPRKTPTADDHKGGEGPPDKARVVGTEMRGRSESWGSFFHLLLLLPLQQQQRRRRRHPLSPPLLLIRLGPSVPGSCTSPRLALRLGQCGVPPRSRGGSGLRDAEVEVEVDERGRWELGRR